MFDWITKPYIEWNVLDTTCCYLEVAIGCIILAFIAVEILEIKDKLKRRKQ